MEEKQQQFYTQAHFWGRITLIIGMFGCIAFPLWLSFGRGWHPGWPAVGAALLGVAALVGHVWWNPTGVLTYVSTMGSAGAYMGSLTGNVENMKIPSSLTAQATIDAEPGTPQGEVMSIMGIVSSTAFCTFMLLVLAIVGGKMVQIFPQSVRNTFPFVVPAVQGACFGRFATFYPKYAIVAIIFASIFILWVPWPSYAETPLTVLGTALVAWLDFQRKEKAKSSGSAA